MMSSLPREMAAEVTEELDDLWPFIIGTGEEPEVETPPGDPRDRREQGSS